MAPGCESGRRRKLWHYRKGVERSVTGAQCPEVSAATCAAGSAPTPFALRVDLDGSVPAWRVPKCMCAGGAVQ
jgi:hypothetical protein